MAGISRRELLSSGLALSASSLVARSAWGRTAAMIAGSPGTASAESQAALAPREQLLFDFGWKFQFGHGTDPARDLGFGIRPGRLCQDRRFRLCQGEFDDSKWRTLNLPHDWAVELPFVRDEDLEIARLQAARPPLSGDQRGLVPARVRDSGQRPGPPHHGRVRRRLPRSC